jgi:signal peptidase I
MSSGRASIWRRPGWKPAVAAVLVAVALGAAYLWLGRIYHVSSASMEPTLESGDRILVSLRGDIQRGDIVVVDVRNTWAVRGGGDATVVKRVVGLPGDRVVCCDDDGAITVSGEPLAEPYLADGYKDIAGLSYDVVVPPDRLWLLGDSRANSRDARDHLGSPGGGTVSTDDVVGRAIAVVWPPVRALDRQAG